MSYYFLWLILEPLSLVLCNPSVYFGFSNKKNKPRIVDKMGSKNPLLVWEDFIYSNSSSAHCIHEPTVPPTILSCNGPSNHPIHAKLVRKSIISLFGPSRRYINIIFFLYLKS